MRTASDGPTSENELVARNVRRYRMERAMSLGDLARRSGLSKQTLSKIEQGIGNPTVETLSQLATALDVSTRRLLTEWGTPVYVQRNTDSIWTDHDGRAERMLDDTYGSGHVRTLVLRLERGTTDPHPIEPYPPGTLHHIYVITGKLRTGPLDDTVDLTAGDFVRFPGDVAHRHICLSERVVAHMVSTIPQLRQFGSTLEVTPASTPSAPATSA
ncbi:XRE family transcriptional regulator [Nocardia sp. NPDC005745]|uniref:helix-turn-helix domain-containing protein n=1 Tax=Nocardia sp. NPDC005745 TaxID=3157061 RepID=UPI0033E232C6